MFSFRLIFLRYALFSLLFLSLFLCCFVIFAYAAAAAMSYCRASMLLFSRLDLTIFWRCFSSATPIRYPSTWQRRAQRQAAGVRQQQARQNVRCYAYQTAMRRMRVARAALCYKQPSKMSICERCARRRRAMSAPVAFTRPMFRSATAKTRRGAMADYIHITSRSSTTPHDIVAA